MQFGLQFLCFILLVCVVSQLHILFYKIIHWWCFSFIFSTYLSLVSHLSIWVIFYDDVCYLLLYANLGICQVRIEGFYGFVSLPLAKGPCVVIFCFVCLVFAISILVISNIFVLLWRFFGGNGSTQVLSCFKGLFVSVGCFWICIKCSCFLEPQFYSS